MTFQEFIDGMNANEIECSIPQLVDDCKRAVDVPFDISEEPDWGDMSVEKRSYVVVSLDNLWNIYRSDITKPDWVMSRRFVPKNPYFAMNAQ